jgi:hypothetical protein
LLVPPSSATLQYAKKYSTFLLFNDKHSSFKITAETQKKHKYEQHCNTSNTATQTNFALLGEYQEAGETLYNRKPRAAGKGRASREVAGLLDLLVLERSILIT